MSDIIKAITETVFISDAPKPSSAIVLADGSFPAPVLKASQLFKAGYAKRIVIGGGVNIFNEKDELHLKKRIESEELFYRELFEYLSVCSDAIFCTLNIDKGQSDHEKQSDNTSMLLVCKAHLAGRSKAAYKLAFPNSEIMVVPQESEYLNSENWFLDSKKIDIVLREAIACGFDIRGYDQADDMAVRFNNIKENRS